MKYCSFCGEELNDDASICEYCGCSLNPNDFNVAKEKPLRSAFVGFILTFFLNIVGLILSLCLGDKRCKTGAIIALIILLCSELPAIFMIVYFLITGGRGATPYAFWC